MKMEFKDILKELRTDKGLSQIELASELKVSKAVISLWENGLREPKMSYLILIAQYFGVTIDYLVGIEK